MQLMAQVHLVVQVQLWVRQAPPICVQQNQQHCRMLVQPAAQALNVQSQPPVQQVRLEAPMAPASALALVGAVQWMPKSMASQEVTLCKLRMAQPDCLRGLRVTPWMEKPMPGLQRRLVPPNPVFVAGEWQQPLSLH